MPVILRFLRDRLSDELSYLIRTSSFSSLPPIDMQIKALSSLARGQPGVLHHIVSHSTKSLHRIHALPTQLLIFVHLFRRLPGLSLSSTPAVPHANHIPLFLLAD